jgi:hypothetical protein
MRRGREERRGEVEGEAEGEETRAEHIGHLLSVTGLACCQKLKKPKKQVMSF